MKDAVSRRTCLGRGVRLLPAGAGQGPGMAAGGQGQVRPGSQSEALFSVPVHSAPPRAGLSGGPEQRGTRALGPKRLARGASAPTGDVIEPGGSVSVGTRGLVRIPKGHLLPSI